MTGPLLVIVTGHPASGKTTLARRLSDELQVPLVAKDGIKERLFDVLGGGDSDWSHRLGLAAMKLLYDQLESILTAGVAVVAEANFDRELATVELGALIGRTNARVVQVVMRADGDELVRRFRDRIDSGERHPGHPQGRDVVAELAAAVRDPYVPPDLPGPTVDVDVNDLDAYDEEATIREVVDVVGRLG